MEYDVLYLLGPDDDNYDDGSWTEPLQEGNDGDVNGIPLNG